MSANSKDRVFELVRQLAIKDRQLFEERKALAEATRRIKSLYLENQQYKVANTLLRESIRTIETQMQAFTAGMVLNVAPDIDPKFYGDN